MVDMENRIKVVSYSKSGLTINLRNLNGKQIPVAPLGFAYLTSDELAYVMNTSKVFERGSLKVESEVPVELTPPVSPNALSDDDIVALLKKTQKQIEAELGEIDNINVVRRILGMANELDKSVRVVGLIEKRIEELMD